MNIFEMNYYFVITIYLQNEVINLIIVSNENFRFGKNRVIFLCVSGYTFYRSLLYVRIETVYKKKKTTSSTEQAVNENMLYT
jgi:hypothetical protein